MGLAGKDDLDRPLGIVEQPIQPLEVGHDQVGPLVGGKAPGKADRQDVRIEQVAGGLDHGVALAAAAALPADAAADERQQQVLERVVHFPQFARIDLVDVLPDVRLAHPLQPADGKVAVVELQHLPGQPTGHVHAVGDVADGNFFFHAPRPQVGPHPPRDVAVQATDGVGPPRQLEPQHGHAEAFALVVRLDAAQAHQLLVARCATGRAAGPSALRSGRRRSGRVRPARACAW